MTLFFLRGIDHLEAASPWLFDFTYKLKMKLRFLIRRNFVAAGWIFLCRKSNWSYEEFMTAWIVKRQSRFYIAASWLASCCINNKMEGGHAICVTQILNIHSIKTVCTPRKQQADISVAGSMRTGGQLPSHICVFNGLRDFLQINAHWKGKWFMWLT